MSKIFKIAFLGVAISVMVFYSTVFAQEVNSVVDANNQFAFELYAKYKLKDGNVFFSPYSISSAVAMAYEGARGETAEQIQSVFHFPKDDSLRREAFVKVNNFINKKDKKYQLCLANALWAQKDYVFTPDYFSLIKNYYDGNATNLDFKADPGNSCLIINEWIEERTNGKIKDLIPGLDRLTRLVLTNAIYFKGFWLKQFKKSYTQEEEFSVSADNRIKVPMMHLSGEEANFNYLETPDFQILELPYEGNELAMLILLPKGDNLQVLEESLSLEKLSEWKRQLRNQEIDVYLPKFKFENKYFMRQDLKSLGVLAAFTPGIDFEGEADFSGMTGKRDLHIDEIVHQAFIEVNEEGTEAAAATAVMMLAGKGMSMPPKIFKADHAFIFIIQDKEMGNILFMGRVSDPAK